MSIFNVNGASLLQPYGINGASLSKAYNYTDSIVWELDDGDYNEYSTEYQHTILQARDAWKTEYRADNTIIPIVVHTDQHRILNTAHKPTFDYLARAIKWSEVSAIINFGDVCGAAYNTIDLNNMNTCLSALPRAKRIDIAGNHDTQLPRAEGSSYAYAPLTDELFHTLQDVYFNNSQFGGNNSNTRYGFKGMEYVIDPLHNIKFCIFAIWVTRGDPWYRYFLDSTTMEAIISMLSSVDDHDIIVLSHVEPYARLTTWYIPPVDGEPASSETKEYDWRAIGDSVRLDQLFADRKAKRAGTIADVDGVIHNYDFTSCTSDLICVLNGHQHSDRFIYSPDGNTPAILFDAYRYDNCPMFFVNVDRARERVNVWKFDEANNIYNYQIPFTEVSE